MFNYLSSIELLVLINAKQIHDSFPLGDQARLQQWVLNVRRLDWNPNPHSRLCSQHFKDDCFYKDRKGNIRLSTSAVPTLFSYPCLRKKSHTKTIKQESVNSEHCYSLDLPITQETQDIPVFDLQALDNFSDVGTIEEIDNTEAQVVSLNKSLVVNQTFGIVDDTEDASECGLSEDNKDQLHYIMCVTHDHRYFTDKHPCPLGEHGYSVAESPRTLKRRLDVVNDHLTTCRKQLKLQRAKNSRLKRKVSALSFIIQDLKKSLLMPKNNLMKKSHSPLVS